MPDIWIFHDKLGREGCDRINTVDDNKADPNPLNLFGTPVTAAQFRTAGERWYPSRLVSGDCNGFNTLVFSARGVIRFAAPAFVPPVGSIQEARWNEVNTTMVNWGSDG